jgi:thymidine kinase
MRTTDPDARERAAGQIEIITGGMFSGKSEELLRRVRRALIARQKVQVFKPAADIRHRPERVVTRDLREVSALAVAGSRELRAALVADVQVVGIDEAQFFDDGLIDLATELADRGVRVIIAGLDQDFMRRPFGPMPALLSLAEFVDKMHAICVVCGQPAHFTQRTAGGEELVQVGDSESYEARCRACYERGLAQAHAAVPAADRQSID